MADNELNNIAEIDSELANASQIDSDVTTASTLSSNMDAVVEVSKIYTGDSTDDIVVTVNNTTNKISAEFTTARKNEIAGKQDTLTAGDNITIGSDNTISATDTKYTAGTGISISEQNVISNTQTSAEWGNIDGELSDQTDLKNALDSKQNVIQYATMPTASASYLNQTVQFVGTTTSTYTNSYFYKCVLGQSTTPATLTLTASGTAGLGTVTGNVDTFEDKVDNYQDDYVFKYNAQVETIKVGSSGEDDFTLTRSRNEDENSMYAWVDSSDNTYFTTTQTPELDTLFYNVAENDTNYASSLWFVEISTYSSTYGKWQRDLGSDEYEDVNLTEYGISYNGVAIIGAIITATFTPEVTLSNTYVWTQTNVQPSGISTVNWGSIGGTLSNQTDLNTALAGKQDIIQCSTMPTASSSNVGKIVEYTGTTTSSYTNGYFYKSTLTTTTIPESVNVIISGTAGLGTVVCNASTFGDAVSENEEDAYVFVYRGKPETITVHDNLEDYNITRAREFDNVGAYAWETPSNTLLYTSTDEPDDETSFYTTIEMSDYYRSSAFYIGDVTLSDTYGRWQLDYGDDLYEDVSLEDYGITYNGVALIGAKITVSYTAEVNNPDTYSWVQINTQPSNVISVNGETGAVVLDADDIGSSGTTNQFVTSSEKTTWNGKASQSDLTALTTRVTTAESDIDTIEGKIPTEASSENQLADKSFVNSSIATETATFRGTSATELTEAQFLAWANAITPKDNNDYVFWNTTDSDGNVVFKRYKYNGTSWVYEYSLNNSSFTSTQWSAINSNITTGLVSDINSNTSARHTHSNKAVLDNLTQSVIDNSHTHSNKSILDATTASYTTTDQTKLSGIEAGAEVNVQSDWSQTDTTADDYIKNKPTIPTVNNSTITITQGGTTKGSFTTNQSSNQTIALDAGGSSVSIDNSSITNNASSQIQTVGVIDQKTSNTNKQWTGTLAEYNALSTIDNDTLYFITDDNTFTGVNSLGGVSGAILLGANLSISGNTLNATDTDTGATSVEATGSGNAVTSATYDSLTRKITLEKATTFLTEHQDISGKADKTATVSNVSMSGNTLQKTINGTTTDVTTFGSNAFTNTTIPTTYVSTIGNTSGAITLGTNLSMSGNTLNATGGSAGVTVTTLWTNSNPSSAFGGPTTITVSNMSDYKFFIFGMKAYKSNDYQGSVIVPNKVMSEFLLQGMFFSGELRYRFLTITSTGLTIGNAFTYNLYGGNYTEYNDSCIPLYILGVK